MRYRPPWWSACMCDTQQQDRDSTRRPASTVPYLQAEGGDERAWGVCGVGQGRGEGGGWVGGLTYSPNVLLT